MADQSLSCRLDDSEISRYSEWVDNWELMKIIKEMEKVSDKASKILIRQAAKSRS